MARNLAIILFIVSFFGQGAYAAKPQLPVPRFVSLRSSEVNVRTGPGPRYQIKWVLVRKEMPVEIVAEFEQWRKIKDISGDEGWAHKTMLAGKRTAIININGPQNAATSPVPTQIALYRQPDETSRIMMFAENGVIGELISCKADWCRMKIQGKKGWTYRKNIWGVYPDESLD